MTRNDLVSARVLLGWSPEWLAKISGVPLASVFTLERIGSADAQHKHRMRVAFERAGIEFTNEQPARVKWRNSG